MSDLTEEEKQEIEQRHPWATFWIMIILFAMFIAGWLYFWDWFVSQGPIH